MKKNALHKHRRIAMKWPTNEWNYSKLSQAIRRKSNAPYSRTHIRIKRTNERRQRKKTVWKNNQVDSKCEITHYRIKNRNRQNDLLVLVHAKSMMILAWNMREKHRLTFNAWQHREKKNTRREKAHCGIGGIPEYDADKSIQSPKNICVVKRNSNGHNGRIPFFYIFQLWPQNGNLT